MNKEHGRSMEKIELSSTIAVLLAWEDYSCSIMGGTLTAREQTELYMNTDLWKKRWANVVLSISLYDKNAISNFHQQWISFVQNQSVLEKKKCSFCPKKWLKIVEIKLNTWKKELSQTTSIGIYSPTRGITLSTVKTDHNYNCSFTWTNTGTGSPTESSKG